MTPLRHCPKATLSLGVVSYFLSFFLPLSLLMGVAHAGTRPAPERPLTLKSSSLSVVFDPSDGLPYKYEFGSGHIWGEDTGSRMPVTLCRLQPRLYATPTLRPAASKLSESEVSFRFEAVYQGQPAA